MTREGDDPYADQWRRSRFDLRSLVAAVGRTMIGGGLLLLLFVGYQLWGTNIAEARSQDELKEQFAQVVSAPPTAPAGGTPLATTTTVPPPPPPQGEAVAMLRIPKIGLEKAVVEGVSVADLKKGPGHYPGTPMPGQPGNAAIAGHRTTYGAPFSALDELTPGDVIEVTTLQGTFRYEVTGSSVVAPSQSEVLDPTEDNRLTLTTCHPKYSASQRLIVVAKLVTDAAPAPPEAPAPAPDAGDRGAEAPVERPGLDAGLSGDLAARGPTVLWGSVAAAVGVLVWVLGRLWRRWPAYALGALPFLAALFVFFENVSRLLPANI